MVQPLQVQAYQHYLNKQYPLALECYSECLKLPSTMCSPLRHLLTQSTIAIIHIHMNNHQQAHAILTGLEKNLPKYLETGDKKIEFMVIAIKVQCSLLLIQLINCQAEYVDMHLQKMLDYIQESVSQDQLLLFQCAMKMMFGLGSFSELQTMLPPNSSGASSQILLSSLSLTHQLCGSIELSYKLQYRNYTNMKSMSNPKTIPLLISIKHLIHLCEIMNNMDTATQYCKQFQILMNTPQIYGISLQTLFRAYEDKIQIGTRVVQALSQFQQQLTDSQSKVAQKANNSNKDSWLHHKLLNKLQQALSEMQNNPNQQNTIPLEQTLSSLKSFTKGTHILKLLKNTPLVQQIVREQQKNIQTLCTSVGRVGVGGAMGMLKMLPPRVQGDRGNQGEIYAHRQREVQGKERYERQERDRMQREREFKSKIQREQEERDRRERERILRQKQRKEEQRRIREEQYQRQMQEEMERKIQQERQRKLQQEEFLRQDQLRQRQKQEQYKKQYRRLQELRKGNNQSPFQNKSRVQREEQQRYESQRYEDYRRRQQKQLKPNYNTNPYIQQNIGGDNVSQRQRTRQHVGYRTQISKSPKARSKIEKINVISRSPRNVVQKNQHHREHSRSFVEGDRQNFNNSRIANHMNTVYLDSDSSRLVNPLEQLYDNQSGSSAFKTVLDKQIQPEQSKKQIAQEAPGKGKKQNVTESQPTNIMSILKSQDSRIKQTFKQSNMLQKQRQKKLAQQNSIMSKMVPQENASQIAVNEPVEFSNVNILVQPVVDPNGMSKSRINKSPIQQGEQRGTQPQNVSPFEIVISKNEGHKTGLTTDYRSIVQEPIDNNRYANIRKTDSESFEVPPRQPSQPQVPIGQQNIQPPVEGYGQYGQPAGWQGQGQWNMPPKQSQIGQGQMQSHLSQPPSQISAPRSQLKSKMSLAKWREERLNPTSPYIKKYIKICTLGQYFVKRHYSSDGGEERFMKLAPGQLRWASDEDKINNKYQSINLLEIKGIVYGRVTENMQKDCNKKLEPWLCFSLVTHKRTLDFCFTDQMDPVIWLPGLTASLAGQSITLKYPKTKQKFQVPNRLMTPGKVLWKRFLFKLKHKYVKPLKKYQKAPYKNINAHAIIQWNKQFNKNRYNSQSASRY